jgi:hypothetical protein
MSISLAGTQRRVLHTLLLGTFPTQPALALMLQYKLNVHLSEVASSDSYADIVVHLISWAEAHGRIEELIRAAFEEAPEDPRLRALGQDVGLIPSVQEPGVPEHDESAEVLKRAATDDLLAAARRRGAQAKRDLLAAQGDLLDADEVAARLHDDVTEVERRRSQGLLLALPTASGKFGFPSWQFTDSGLLPGLSTVFRDFGVRDPWMQAAFFLSGNLRLGGRTPLEVLLRGDVEAVRSAAAAFGEQGAA